MNDPVRPQNAAQKNAQKYFKKTAQDEAATKDAKKTRKEGAAKMGKLRALRLAKEAADKEAAGSVAVSETDAVRPAQRKRAAASKLVKFVRMTY
jgi:hypothetical protein